MECVLSGNQIKSFHRAIVCFARIGAELLVDARQDKLVLRTLNTSRSAFLAVTFKGQFFDSFQLSVPAVQCSMLLKSICTIFRTPASMQQLSITLPDKNADKVQWTLSCSNGLKKTYWISCTNDMEVQDVAISRRDFRSHLVVKPRDLNRLLANFQSTLHEITLIATESSLTPTDPLIGEEAKALELRSYIDPVEGNTDGSLHTQLWIDPMEELQEYTHSGDAVDVTFSIKELKAFMAFCEGAEADVHMFFEKAGKPILLAPRFGLDDAAHADFDATLVLATMLGSQLRSAERDEQAHPVNGNMGSVHHSREASEGRQGPRTPVPNPNGMNASTPGSNQRSDHTVIWSDLSGSIARTSHGPRTSAVGPIQVHDSGNASEEIFLGRQRLQMMSQSPSNALQRLADPCQSDLNRFAARHSRGGEAVPEEPVLQRDEMLKWQSHGKHASPHPVQLTGRNLSNWISDDTEDEDCTGVDDFCVQSTPPRN